MKRLTILLSQLIIDTEIDTDFTAMDPAEIEQILQDRYSFLPPSVVVSVEQDAIILQSDEDVDLVGPALKQYGRTINAAHGKGDLTKRGCSHSAGVRFPLTPAPQVRRRFVLNQVSAIPMTPKISLHVHKGGITDIETERGGS